MWLTWGTGIEFGGSVLTVGVLQFKGWGVDAFEFSRRYGPQLRKLRLA